MGPEVIAVLILACVGLTAAFAVVARSSRKVQQAGVYAASLSERGSALERKLVDATAEVKRRSSWLDHQDQEMHWLKSELEKRPRLARKIYKILTLGIKGTGKTCLTLKWANLLVDLATIEGTKIERYERTVSQVLINGVMTEHVFEIGDWGGEHIVEAQHELIVDEIHGLLMVVDLGGPGATQVEPERIQAQLREFEPQALRYFFGPKTVAVCKTVVLFINKSDLIPGSPAHAEKEAKRYYAQLIADLTSYSSQVDICVLVGSASYGHSTHHLFSHFVRQILPSNAYDAQLVQRIKGEAVRPRPPKDEGE
jgi:hypothetical protein